MKMNKYIKVDRNTVEIRNSIDNKLVSIIDNDEELIGELKKFDWESDKKSKEAVTDLYEKKYYLKNVIYLFYYGKENALEKYYLLGGNTINKDWVK